MPGNHNIRLFKIMLAASPKNPRVVGMFDSLAMETRFSAGSIPCTMKPFRAWLKAICRHCCQSPKHRANQFPLYVRINQLKCTCIMFDVLVT